MAAEGAAAAGTRGLRRQQRAARVSHSKKQRAKKRSPKSVSSAGVNVSAQRIEQASEQMAPMLKVTRKSNGKKTFTKKASNSVEPLRIHTKGRKNKSIERNPTRQHSTVQRCAPRKDSHARMPHRCANGEEIRLALLQDLLAVSH